MSMTSSITLIIIFFFNVTDISSQITWDSLSDYIFCSNKNFFCNSVIQIWTISIFQGFNILRNIHRIYLIIDFTLAMRYHSPSGKVCLNILEMAWALPRVRSQLAFATHHPLLFKAKELPSVRNVQVQQQGTGTTCRGKNKSRMRKISCCTKATLSALSWPLFEPQKVGQLFRRDLCDDLIALL